VRRKDICGDTKKIQATLPGSWHDLDRRHLVLTDSLISRRSYFAGMLV
jgi:hypothetical protein